MIGNEKQIIAERSIGMIEGDKIRVVLWRPIASIKHEDEYKCEYQIIGMGDEKVRYAIGIDGFQAIYLAMRSIGSDIYNSIEYKQGKIYWLDPKNKEFGFPLPSGILDYKEDMI